MLRKLEKTIQHNHAAEPARTAFPAWIKVIPIVRARPVAASKAVRPLRPFGTNKSTSRSAQAQTVKITTGRMV